MLIVLLALALPDVAAASSGGLVPQGNAAVNQYVDPLPTSAGERPTNTIHVGGVPGSGTHGGPPGGSDPISSRTANALAAEGPRGAADAAFVRATAPAARRRTSSGDSRIGPSSSPSASSGSVGSSAMAVIKALTGGGGGLGVLLPIVLGAVVFAAAGFAISRRRRAV